MRLVEFYRAEKDSHPFPGVFRAVVQPCCDSSLCVFSFTPASRKVSAVNSFIGRQQTSLGNRVSHLFSLQRLIFWVSDTPPQRNLLFLLNVLLLQSRYRVGLLLTEGRIYIYIYTLTHETTMLQYIYLGNVTIKFAPLILKLLTSPLVFNVHRDISSLHKAEILPRFSSNIPFCIVLVEYNG